MPLSSKIVDGSLVQHGLVLSVDKEFGIWIRVSKTGNIRPLSVKSFGKLGKGQKNKFHNPVGVIPHNIRNSRSNVFFVQAHLKDSFTRE